jgi:glycogen synthase
MTRNEPDWQAVLAAVKKEYQRCVKAAGPYPIHRSFYACEAMEAVEASMSLPTHGVEGWSRGVSGRTGVEYLNTGDSYGTTIVCVSGPNRATFRVGCWADYVRDRS